MSRPACVMALTAAVFVALLALFRAVLGPGDGGAAWAVFCVCGGITLLATAFELVMLLVWLGIRLSLLRPTDCVPVMLEDAERAELAARHRRVAILIPAHCEAATAADARALAERLLDTLLKIPAFAVVYVLFDSPREQIDNERRAIASVRAALRAMNRAAAAERLCFKEYRKKPPEMRNKPGSVELWLEEFGLRYDQCFILDADSCFPDEDPDHPETCDVLARLVLAMERTNGRPDEIAMIQTAIEIRPAVRYERRSIWASYQRAGAQLGRRFHALVLPWTFRGQSPSYGHSVLFRVASFVKHTRGSYRLLSHDYAEAALLAAAGCRCEFTNRAVTHEEPESGVQQWVARDSRWAAGDAGWIVFLFQTPGLRAGSVLAMALGILGYFIPFVATLCLAASAVLIGQGVTLIADRDPHLTQTLLGLVLAALFLPKAVAFRSPGELALAVLPAALLAPALSVLSGFFLLFGAFSSSWKLRGSRVAEPGLDELLRLVWIFVPVSLFGALLWSLVESAAGLLGELLVRVTILAWVASPLIAVLFSLPWPCLTAPPRPTVPHAVTPAARSEATP